MYRSTSVPALHIGKRRSNWLAQAGCQTPQNRSCKNVNARALGEKGHAATAVALVAQGTLLRVSCCPQGALVITFLTYTSKSLKLSRAVTDTTLLTLWLWESGNSRKQTIGQTYSNPLFFVPKKTDVATKSGLWRFQEKLGFIMGQQMVVIGLSLLFRQLHSYQA